MMEAFPGIFPYVAFHSGTAKMGQFTYLHTSALGKNKRTPAYVSPLLAYKDLFGTTMTGKNAEIELAAHKNLMDFLIEHIANTVHKLTFNGNKHRRFEKQQF